VQGLAAWRQRDCRDAASAFDAVSRRASDPEMRSAGLYWLSRAHMACERPGDVTAALRGAAQYDETFYGLLARQALGIEEAGAAGEQYVTADWRALQERSNVRTAAALMEIGEAELAEEVLKHQARIGNAGEHGALTRLAGRLNLPSTQLWLSHNAPADAPPVEMARYPAPNWTPDGGWRVDRALVFAHTLQESRFRTEVRSAAGAMGLMQVREGAAIDVSRRRGVDYASADLTDPSINMEIGQSYLEQLRDTAFTQGLLPKVIAAYNAGPTPVQAWNSLTKDNGDPLLYIESIPYWETRGYVMIVLRNYWMYQRQDGRRSASRAALAQGLWPRFPGLPGQEGIRLSGGGGGQAVVLTVSDTRGPEDDRSGDLLVERLTGAGHTLADRAIVRDDAETIADTLDAWIDDPQVEVILTTGGTGVTGRDVTPEALARVWDKEIPGFGELFRWLSYRTIGTSTIQSRATAGVARGTYIFCLPGSTGAVKDGWDGILRDQLDIRHKPCNFVELLPRLTER